ncbi:MAG: GNAT family N-acetyltransferase [Candidatus Competibacter sp.]|jgi:ribosomal-protein-alanine N-acetyltransferase|nr:GNAT family N-acetyltransferase [Candidatus Competibacteraceae bacterium]
MLSETAIILAAARDAPIIAAMSREYIEQGLGWRWTTQRVLAAIRDPERNVAVIRGGGTVIAFGIMSYAEDYAHLELLAVLPTKRRQGLASAIVVWLERAARVAGIERIFVECRRNNDAARNFYHEHCYHERQLDKGMYRGIEDGIRLQKWLRTPD